MSFHALRCFFCDKILDNSPCPCSTPNLYQQQDSPMHSAHIDLDFSSHGRSLSTPSIHLNDTVPSFHCWDQPRRPVEFFSSSSLPSLTQDQYSNVPWNSTRPNAEQDFVISYDTLAPHDHSYSPNGTLGLIREPHQNSDHIEGYLSGLEGLTNIDTLANQNATTQEQAFTAEDGDEPFLDNVSPAEASSQFLTVLPFRQRQGSVTYTGASGTQSSWTSTSSGPLSSIASDVGEGTSEPRHGRDRRPRSYKCKSSVSV
ncbi:hypothetical protein FKW77_008452 [Venturia effusa]|uniref:Uncharacterized protein n=1 Tax=Venturia effusa TaxID=50376 RepID=A0A517L1T6_9PEZI|nr:hypothetical protein FKW77_008452 [Venturia effusa]